MACVAVGAAGPSPAPSRMRQAISTSRLTVPSIGNCATDQTIAMTRSVWRVWHAVGDEADQHRGDGEQEEERRADQPELLGRQLQLGHDRLGGEADHDLVGEVDQHEEEDQGGHAPGPLEGPILYCHLGVTPVPVMSGFWRHETGAADAAQGPRRSRCRDQARAGCAGGIGTARAARRLRSSSGRMKRRPMRPPASSRPPRMVKPRS